MKYPVWLKVKETGKIYKAIDYLDLSDCYDCQNEEGKRELISICEPVLYSRDKINWLSWEELDELDNPKVEYQEGTAIYYINKYIGKAFDEIFKKENKDE